MPNTCKHCKVIDLVESQEQLVALITFTDSAFDLQLTDAVDAWSGQGCSLENRGFPKRYEPAEWLSRARDALCAAAPSTRYKYRITQRGVPPCNLQLRWSWQEEDNVTNTAWVELTPASPPGPLIRNMLLELAGSYSTVQAAVGELDGHLASMKQQLATKDAALRAEIDQRLERERGLFLKFAELLNQKKSKLAQLQQQVTELSATVEKLRVAAQDAAEQDTDDEALQQEYLGAAPGVTDPAYDADTEDDEDEEQPGGQQQQPVAALKEEPGVDPAAAAAAGSMQRLQSQLPAPPQAAAAIPGGTSSGAPTQQAPAHQPGVGAAAATRAEQLPPQHIANAAAATVPAGGPSRQQEAGQQQWEQYDLMDAATQPIPDELLPQELLQRRQQKTTSTSQGALQAAPGPAHSSPAVVKGHPAQQQQQQQQEEEMAPAAADDDPLGLAGLLPGGDAAPPAAAVQPKIRKRARR